RLEEQQGEQRADAGRGKRRQDRDWVDETFVQHAEHDVDGEKRRQDEHRLALQRFLELLRRAGEARLQRRRHADFLLRALDGGHRLTQRSIRGEIEGQRHRGKLSLVAHRERRPLGGEARERGKRHGVAVLSLHVDRVERVRLRRQLGLHLEYYPVLVRLREHRADLPLAEGVVQRRI